MPKYGRKPAEKQHYHVFMDFKKAFDIVWPAALWATMRLYSINDNLIRTVECLYNEATSAVYHDNNIGEWFRTTIGVRQGCLLSPALFNIFLERIIIIIAFKGAIRDFFTISSMRREPSPTCTLKWPGSNLVQITCNTSSACHVQHVVLRATSYKGTVQLLSLTELKLHLF